MSQFFTNISGSNLPSNIPTSFAADQQDTTTASFPASAGSAVPVSNVLRVTGIEGIQTYQSTKVPGVLEIGYNGGNITTSDGLGQTRTIMTLTPPDNSAQTYQFLIIGYDAANGIAFGGQLVGVARVVAGAATVLPTPDKFVDQDAGLVGSNIAMVASGATILVQVTGIAGHTIDWAAINAAGVITAT